MKRQAIYYYDLSNSGITSPTSEAGGWRQRAQTCTVKWQKHEQIQSTINKAFMCFICISLLQQFSHTQIYAYYITLSIYVHLYKQMVLVISISILYIMMSISACIQIHTCMPIRIYSLQRGPNQDGGNLCSLNPCAFKQQTTIIKHQPATKHRQLTTNIQQASNNKQHAAINTQQQTHSTQPTTHISQRLATNN